MTRAQAWAVQHAVLHRATLRRCEELTRAVMLGVGTFELKQAQGALTDANVALYEHLHTLLAPARASVAYTKESRV